MDAIPLLDLTHQYRMLAPQMLAQVEAALASGYYIGGALVAQFEQQFAQFLNAYSSGSAVEAIGCNSGTDALYLALRALDIGPGDEVLTSAFSFFASAGTISQTGATPVFVDIDPRTFNLDPDRLAERVTPRTRAIVPVHLFGQAANLDAVMAVARQHHLAVVEDCAQAVGSCWAGRAVGTWGDLAAFSFFPTKNLGAAGDAGAVVTADPDLARKIRILKNHGQTQQYRTEMIGINSRLDALQAAVLLAKLPHLREWNWRRQTLAAYYGRLLGDIPGLILPELAPGGSSVWHQYTVRILGGQRDRVMHHLKDLSIDSRIYYPQPLHLQPVYRALGHAAGQHPAAESCADEVLSLPMFPELSGSQQERVAAGLRQALAEIEK